MIEETIKRFALPRNVGLFPNSSTRPERFFILSNRAIEKIGGNRYRLFDLVKDKKEEKDLFATETKVAARMRKALDAFTATVTKSQAGADYPEGKVTREGPHGRFLYAIEGYKPFLKDWTKRPEYKNWANRLNKSNKPKKPQNKKNTKKTKKK